MPRPHLFGLYRIKHYIGRLLSTTMNSEKWRDAASTDARFADRRFRRPLLLRPFSQHHRSAIIRADCLLGEIDRRCREIYDRAENLLTQGQKSFHEGTYRCLASRW